MQPQLQFRNGVRGHIIELKPNNKQVTYFKKACGVARFAYNWELVFSRMEKAI